MKTLTKLLGFLYKKRILHFLATGATGIALNMLITWSLTEFVFGVDRYFVGYTIGTALNICYNFAIHTILTFGTKNGHGVRFAGFTTFNLISTTVQMLIVRTLTEYFGQAYYLPIIAATITMLSVVSYLFFKLSLFNEKETREHLLLRTPKDELHAMHEGGVLLLSSLRAWASRDRNALLIIIVLAILTRLPMIGHPPRTVFDEVIYSDFAIHIIDERPVFDIHPPLARMIFAGIANNTSFIIQDIPLETNIPFYDFPYTRVRIFVAFLGILLSVLIYGIARALGQSPLQALIPALFVIFDNALVLYSRTVLPDTLLLLANFLGLACVLALITSSRLREKIPLILLAGIFAGAALSIKWTALGVLGLSLLALLWKRKWVALFSIPLIAVATYVSIFALYLSGFHAGGHLDPLFPAYNTEVVQKLSFPKGDDLKSVLRFVPHLNSAMVHINGDPELDDLVLRAPKPLAWPAARSSILFWMSDDESQSIMLHGNAVLWLMVFFVFLFELGWILVKLISTRRWPASEAETLLVFGYIMNYLPFFFIHRPMYPYHYFTALIFLFLLTPFVIPRLLYCIKILARDRYVGPAVVSLTCLLILINFFLLAKTTYGI